jgi:hypothetical protein
VFIHNDSKRNQVSNSFWGTSLGNLFIADGGYNEVFPVQLSGKLEEVVVENDADSDPLHSCLSTLPHSD